ncbi:hypothetical protein DQ04_10521000 [Trypanosoma grayi]|uniref:hypothetical protein n=1 Tax=Trypanosoma grayi TaxID=71804 RepID=UPI0004F43831|nr:hypothetical protein DQ04_10521000 [Trypanosoma grayi]KEG07222.1 hypothetical protein DQ04_10521000 [Trypanosoma grayi]
MALASAAAAGLLASWQHRRIYRVWRLRHPRRVAQQRRLMWGSAASSVALLLLLVSPVGCMALHEARHNDARRLDDIAVRALVLKQRYEAAATSGRKEAGDVYDRCEKDWAALMKERVAIDENV